MTRSNPLLRSYRLGWPRSVDPAAVIGFFEALAAEASAGPVILEAIGRDNGIEHYLIVPRARAAAILRRLSIALPGVRASAVDQPLPPVSRALQLQLSSRRRALRADRPIDISTAVVSALAGTRRGEVLRLRWVLGPRLRPVAIPNRFIDFTREGWVKQMLSAPFSAPGPIDPELRGALRAKQSLAGWRAIGRLGVTAADPARQRQLLAGLLAALRVAEAPGLKLEAGSVAAGTFERTMPLWTWPLVINESEIVGLVGWPLGDLPLPGLTRSSHALQPVPASVPRNGRIIGDGTFPGTERPVALRPQDALRHCYLLGPTGVGKSTVLAQLALADAKAGRALVLIDSKGDLVDDVLSRLPENRLDDVIVIDPTEANWAVGLNPLRGRADEAPMLVDRLVSIFRQIYGDNLGPRSEDILHSGLLTLAYAKGQTLAALPLLLTNQAFRRQLTANLDDPLGLGSFWSWYEGLSEGERRQVVAPLMNKLRSFLLRPSMRRMLGQAEPHFSLRQVFTERKLVLVSLAKGALGPETAGLFGALLLNELWQQTLARSSIAAERRHPVMVYVDEFQEYLRLPTPLPDIFAAARGLGVGFTVANQHLDQLTPSVRAAVLGNAGSRVIFRLNEVDAPQLARDSQTLSAEDFRGLGAFEAYASLLADGARTPYASIRTRPLDDRLRIPSVVRRQSGQRWGRPISEVDDALQNLSAPQLPPPSSGPIGRRPHGAAS